MWNINITNILKCPPEYEEENFYTFNPSIIKIPGHNDLFLLAYRVCYYDIAVRLHPWKIWDNGYKYFSDPENVMSRKYRNYMGGEISVSFTKPFYTNPSPEYDSTGLAILKFSNSKFEILYNIYNPFGQEMNQDARLTILNNKIYITYNAFEKYQGVAKATMRYRILTLNFENKSIKMTNEQYMFTHKYNNFEKNCVFSPHGIIYSVGNTFDVIINDQIIKKPSPFEVITKHYGADNVYCSSSTPIIKYGDKWLGCAHIKVVYKKISQIMPFKKFFIQAKKNIKHHGKYVYFAAFYEFNDKLEITRVSNPFIPTHFYDHLPYLLCMPTGLIWLDDKILLSYGEGDSRCKLIILRKDEIEQLLSPKPDCGFYFLTNKFNLQHFGYFGSYNAGDEAFRHVFTYLWDKYYPMANIKFSSPYGSILNVPTVFGGGDVINKHFIDHVPKRSIAVGVGIPYAEFEPLVKKFDKIILRNKSDAKKLGLPYAPDLAFLLPNIYKVNVQRTPKLIGISIMRTYYNPKFTEPYHNYVKEMSSFIRILINNGFSIILIPFCINDKQIKENDLITCKEIADSVDNSSCSIFRPSMENQVFEVYTQIAKVEFMICARFHSHIFSTIHATPFISLTCGRKCIEFMQQENLKDYIFKLKTEKWDLPKTINIVALLEFFNTKYAERNNIHDRLKQTRKYIFNQMQNFEQTYVNLVKKLVGNGTISMFPELENKSSSQFLHINEAANKATKPNKSEPAKINKLAPVQPKKSEPAKINKLAPVQPKKSEPAKINKSLPVKQKKKEPTELKKNNIFVPDGDINVSTVQNQIIQPDQAQGQIIQPNAVQTKVIQPATTHIELVQMQPHVVQQPQPLQQLVQIPHQQHIVQQPPQQQYIVQQPPQQQYIVQQPPQQQYIVQQPPQQQYIVQQPPQQLVQMKPQQLVQMQPAQHLVAQPQQQYIVQQPTQQLVAQPQQQYIVQQPQQQLVAQPQQPYIVQQPQQHLVQMQPAQQHLVQMQPAQQHLVQMQPAQQHLVQMQTAQQHLVQMQPAQHIIAQPQQQYIVQQPQQHLVQMPQQYVMQPSPQPLVQMQPPQPLVQMQPPQPQYVVQPSSQSVQTPYAIAVSHQPEIIHTTQYIDQNVQSQMLQNQAAQPNMINNIEINKDYVSNFI
jgi:polysaccharide pyruvyl transferase WcaK-like protein/predicted GH43/DUF377 family glycosyl hydrolase